MKRTIFVMLILVFSTVMVSARDAATSVGIDSLCGEKALHITSRDDLPEDQETQSLDSLLRQFVTLPKDNVPPLTIYAPKPPAPGAVIFVDSPEGRYFRAIGVRDVKSCSPLDNPQTPFPIGSNTKMFTAAVIYQLQEEGLLSTSGLVSKYLPDEIALWKGAESITIDMLLGHTSGLPDYLNSQNPATIGGRYSAGDWSALPEARTPEALVAEAANAPLLFTPGAEAQWSYSNTGYIMLGQIIERVTGQSYIEAVTKRVIDRLGLKHTVLIANSPPAELGLTGQYIASPFTIETSNWNFTQAWSAGNAVSTPEDMAIFLRAFYTGALYQNPDTLTEMMTRAAPGYVYESDNVYYMHGGYYKGGFLGHGGQTLGTESDVGYHPATDTVIVTWANSSESLTGRGIFHIGHALGLTPSWDEVFTHLPAIASQLGSSTTPALTAQDVIDVTLQASAVYLASTGESKPAPEGSTYSMTFGADGQISIVADCNTVTGSYTTGDGDAINITLGTSTLVACPEGSIADDFLAALEAATRARVVENEGQIAVSLTADDGSLVVFTGTR